MEKLGSGGTHEPQQVSLLQRISAQRDRNTSKLMSPVEQRAGTQIMNNFHYAKNGNGSLRLDMTTVAAASRGPKPLTSNPSMINVSERQSLHLSPVLPATAGPDFGRQAAARAEVVGFNNTPINSSVTIESDRGLGSHRANRDVQLRHSFNGTEIGLHITSPATSHSNAMQAGPSVTFAPLSPDSANSQTPTSTLSHQRTGSAGQWPAAPFQNRTNNMTHVNSFLPNTSNHSESHSTWGLSDPVLSRKRMSGTWL